MIVSAEKIRHIDMELDRFCDVEVKVDAINYLDNDLLARIFMMLPIAERFSMEKVCQKWKEASKLAWCDIKKYKCCDSIGRIYDNQLMTQSYLEKLLLRCGAHLKELSLSKIFNSSILNIISELCKNLTKLEIVIDDELENNANDYIQAFEKLNHLKSIKIHILLGRRSDKMKFQSNVMNFLPEEIKEIHLDVSYKFDYSIELLMFSSDYKCDRPINFSLKKFKNLQRLTLIGFNLNNVVKEISELITLVYLDLLNSCVTDTCLYTGNMYNQLVNLEYISNFSSMWIYNVNIPINIFKTCKNLKSYKESFCMDFSSADKNSFESFTNFQKLEHLKVNWKINDDFANIIINHCKNLKYLDLSGRKTAFRLSQSALQILTKLENLECLKLPNMTLRDESIIAISTNCKQLKNLQISNIFTERFDHQQVSPAFIFDQISKLEYLEYLDISYTVEFQDSSLIAVANKCKNLKDLNLKRCKYITETGLTSLTTLKKLEKLNLSDIDGVTNNLIVQLKGLKCLNVNGCKNLTAGGIIKLLENCPDLEYLNLSKTKITTDIISAVDNATKNRINGIILNIVMYFKNPVQAFNLSKNLKWLNFIPERF